MLERLVQFEVAFSPLLKLELHPWPIPDITDTIIRLPLLSGRTTGPRLIEGLCSLPTQVPRLFRFQFLLCKHSADRRKTEEAD
jgi:hypothetical protein